MVFAAPAKHAALSNQSKKWLSTWDRIKDITD
jgi:hypothetical protein